MGSKRTIFLVYADPGRIQALQSHSDYCPADSWVYLGKDVRFSMWLETIFDAAAKRITISERLQRTAKEHRQHYIDYIGALSEANHNLFWWLCSLSEKNPYISDVFLHFCYIKLALDFIYEEKGDIVIIAESHVLIDIMRDRLNNAPDMRVITIDSFLLGIRERTASILEGTIKKIWFNSNYLARILFARYFKQKRKHEREDLGGSEWIALHSWTDHRSFRDLPVFSDNYFGNMGNEIANRTEHFFYLINVLPTFSYVSAVKGLLKTTATVFLFEELLRPTDALRATIDVRTHFPGFRQCPPLEGIDISRVIQEQCHRDRLGTRSEQSYLSYLVSKSMSHQMKLRSFIYTFENHTWEKMFCSGFKHFSPDTIAVGYAHSIVNPMELSYSRSDRERGIMPIPDIILANGERTKRILIESGFESDRIITSGAFRYQTIHADIENSRKVTGKRILIAVPGELNEALELVYKSIEALSDMQEASIIIKCHPTMPISAFIQYLPNIPPHFIVSEDPIETLLNQVDCVLYTYSTVAVEAFAKRIPLVHVQSDFRIDMDIFEGYECTFPAASSEEIRAAVQDIFSGASIRITDPETILNEFFEPVNTSIIDRIVDGSIRLKIVQP